jgi:hypothetical protein
MVGGTDCANPHASSRGKKVGGTDLKRWVAPIAQTTQASSRGKKVGGTDLKKGKKVGGTDLKWWVAPIAIAIHRLRLRTNAQNANLENAINESKGR